MTSHLTTEPLEGPALVALQARVASPGCGGNVMFLGTVRASKEDGDVEGIEYSAYPEMADGEWGRIIGEAENKWPGARIALRHRVGFIPTGEASIAIAVSAPHSGEAYECSRFLIAETKKRVPVWKKERLKSGEARWVEPTG